MESVMPGIFYLSVMFLEPLKKKQLHNIINPPSKWPDKGWGPWIWGWQQQLTVLEHKHPSLKKQHLWHWFKSIALSLPTELNLDYSCLQNIVSSNSFIIIQLLRISWQTGYFSRPTSLITQFWHHYAKKTTKKTTAECWEKFHQLSTKCAEFNTEQTPYNCSLSTQSSFTAIQI